MCERSVKHNADYVGEGSTCLGLNVKSRSSLESSVDMGPPELAEEGNQGL
jgi:hypothetical protein